MSNEIIIRNLKEKKIIFNNELHILYLDDEPKYLDIFTSGINSFNLGDNDFDGKVKIRCIATADNTEVERILQFDSEVYRVLVCDHNMPKQKGIDFIKYLRPEYPNLICCLYTGAGNINSDVLARCKQEDIHVFSKSDQFSTFILSFINKISRTNFSNNLNIPEEKLSKMDNLYRQLADDLIADMKQIKDRDPDFRIHIGKKIYSAMDIVDELTHKTDFAFDYIHGYLNGLKFFKKKMK